MSINSNVGVTSITLNNSDQPVDNTLKGNYRKYTKLCATFYNPGDLRNNFQNPDIISFPSDFFTLIRYNLVVRSTETNQTDNPGPSDPFYYNKARISSGGFLVDGTNNAIIPPNFSSNNLENLTIGDIELPNVNFLAPLNFVTGEPTQVVVTISHSNDRYTLSLKNLQIKEKASVFLELF